jgi:hypothetical protein
LPVAGAPVGFSALAMTVAADAPHFFTRAWRAAAPRPRRRPLLSRSIRTARSGPEMTASRRAPWCAAKGRVGARTGSRACRSLRRDHHGTRGEIDRSAVVLGLDEDSGLFEVPELQAQAGPFCEMLRNGNVTALARCLPDTPELAEDEAASKWEATALAAEYPAVDVFADPAEQADWWPDRLAASYSELLLNEPTLSSRNPSGS